MKDDKNKMIFSINFIKTIMVFMVVLSVYACATITPLPGGDKDETAPQINTEKSTPNNQTNFNGKSFELVFDEWIQIKDKSQILVSPPLEFNPEITSKGKTLYIELNENEVLKEHTTYVIQLGQSIKDFTEGNVITGYNQVFSTGDYIDSLRLNGSVTDAYTGEALSSIAVMLYESTEDSIVYKERPYYIAITDDMGKFQFENIKPSEYKLIGLEDKNLNYLFDPNSEKIGFVDTLITIDTTMISYQLSLFKEVTELKFLSIEQEQDGFMTLLFNKKLDSIDIEFSKDIAYHQLIKNDSLLLWYQADTAKYSLYVLDDTLKIKYLSDTIKYIDYKSIETGAIHPSDNFNMYFDQWLTKLDTNYISVKDTAGISLSFEHRIDSLDPTHLVLEAEWIEGETYQLELLPNALTDFHKNTNDTIQSVIKIGKLDDYGTIIFNISNLDSLYEYIVKLKKGDQLLSTYVINEGMEKSIHTFERLLEGDYDIEIVEDRNKDGVWTPGNYLNKQQSEIFDHTKTGQLRKNWDLDVAYSFGTQKEKKIEQDSTQQEVRKPKIDHKNARD